jgi:hypothetical protein
VNAHNGMPKPERFPLPATTVLVDELDRIEVESEPVRSPLM